MTDRNSKVVTAGEVTIALSRATSRSRWLGTVGRQA